MFASFSFILALVAAAADASQSPLSADFAATADTRYTDSDSKWTTFSHPISRVAVIGAGPAGLQAAAALLAHTNITVRLFERAPAPGGNWFYTEDVPAREDYPDKLDEVLDIHDDLPATFFYEEGDNGMSLDERWRAHWHPRPVWQDMHINAPTAVTELPGMKYPADTPWSASVHAVQRHVRAYASMHGLNVNDLPPTPGVPPITSYATRVERLHKDNSSAASAAQWVLTLRRMQHLPESRRLRAEVWEERFDAVVVATGHFPAPHIPDIEGISDWAKTQSATGKWSVYHAQAYRHAKDYAGKTVLIVGASASATEIAREISPFVHRLIVSTRPNPIRDAYGLDIVFRWPEKAEILPEIAMLEPLARHDQGIADGRIELVNGTVLEGIDEVILATGYRRNTFLPELVNPKTMDNLHWTGHYIHDPTLAYAHAVRPWTHGLYQSEAFARVWAGTARLPNRERMWADYLARKYQFGDVPDIFPQEALLRLYIAWLNSEALELGGQFVESLPLEVREVYAYYTTLKWRKDWFDHGNYTRFDRLPASEWPTPGPPGLELPSGGVGR